MANTPIATLPYPAVGDTPNSPAQTQALATALDPQLLPRYATTTARDAAITAPVAGQMCWTTTPATFWYYSGSGWVVVGGSTWGRCRIRRAANQSIPNNASAILSWDTEDQDNGGFIAVPSTTVTIPIGLDGSYDITCRVAGTAGSRSFVECGLTSAVTGVPADYRQVISASENRGLVNITGLPLIGGDTMVFNVFQQSGSAQNWTAWATIIRRSAA